MIEFDSRRRDFLGKAVDAAAVVMTFGFLGGVGGPLAWKEWWDRAGKNETIDGVKRIREHLKKRYDINVTIDFEEGETKTFDEGLNAEATGIRSEYFKYKALENFQHMLAKYPPAALRGLLKEAVIGEKVIKHKWTGDKESVGGTAGRDKHHGTVVVRIEDFLPTYYAVYGNVLSPLYTHHEISHVFTIEKSEQEWQEEVGEKSEYAHWGLWKLAEALKLPLKGFARYYGMADYAEDMATVAEMLFLYPNLIKERAGDAVLMKKVSAMKRIYEQKSGGRMNEQYWPDLWAGKVNESYWDKRGG